jgi:DNA invertase Pin-like site-specific DNA recombinase
MAQTGSKNHNSKLRESNVSEIRRRYKLYLENRPSRIAKDFKIHRSTFDKIVSHSNWRHVK